VSAGRNRLRLAAVMSGASAAMHVSASAGHLREWWVFAALFAATAALQLVWAACVWRRPSRSVISWGLALNLGLVAVWTLSRTRGLPVGPDAFHPEAVGPLDLQSTVDELLTSALVVSTLVVWRSVLASACEALALAAACTSFVVLAAGAGHA
jgi:hypothetical protein